MYSIKVVVFASFSAFNHLFKLRNIQMHTYFLCALGQRTTSTHVRRFDFLFFPSLSLHTLLSWLHWTGRAPIISAGCICDMHLFLLLSEFVSDFTILMVVMSWAVSTHAHRWQIKSNDWTASRYGTETTEEKNFIVMRKEFGGRCEHTEWVNTETGPRIKMSERSAINSHANGFIWCVLSRKLHKNIAY